VDSEAHQWGRIRHSRVRMRDTTFSSKAYGTHEYKDLTIEGRLQFDVYMALQRDHKLSSYTLNAVSCNKHCNNIGQSVSKAAYMLGIGQSYVGLHNCLFYVCCCYWRCQGFVHFPCAHKD
jgi:hypothetical protein